MLLEKNNQSAAISLQFPETDSDVIKLFYVKDSIQGLPVGLFIILYNVCI